MLKLDEDNYHVDGNLVSIVQIYAVQSDNGIWFVD